ncbi:MAG: HAMP domain-containing histidine kinase [Rhodobacteraceae bacterium]|jgi:signal transduction histidine kinase|nr:HAMP domain-containing histidine kinase [Paracoccaceae bacterium]
MARRLRALLRSTPVRTALVLVAVIALVSLTTFSLAYLSLRRDMEANIGANIDQHLSGFRIAATPETLAALVAAEAAGADPADRIFVFLTSDGASVGNARAEVENGEVQLFPRPGGKALGRLGYVSRIVPAAGGLLVVAESRKPLTDLEGAFIRLSVLNLVPTLLISVGGAVLLSLRGARRVARIEATLEGLAAGDLTARVGETGQRDDLARIGAGIDHMAAAQEAATTALRQVSADIAHDLKTPVQRIAVLLSDLNDLLPEDSAEAAIAARAAEEAERAVAVFHALLQIAQIEGGAPRLRFVPVDLTDIARTFAEIYEPAAEDSGHALSLTLPATDVPPVMGDKGLLGQVIANLIENALRHTPRGARIDLSVADTPAGVVLTVADTGPGIPPGEEDKVLRRLYRLDRSRTTPGNGLGLSLVAAIADLHGAGLRLADNAPGLTVTLTFPAAG